MVDCTYLTVSLNILPLCSDKRFLFAATVHKNVLLLHFISP